MKVFDTTSTRTFYEIKQIIHFRERLKYSEEALCLFTQTTD